MRLAKADSDGATVRVLVWGLLQTLDQEGDEVTGEAPTTEDFEACLRLNHRSPKDDSGPDLPSRFKFKAFAPRVFSRLRARTGAPRDLLSSAFLLSPPARAKNCQGRSGVPFFSSQDGAFLLKRLRPDEAKRLRHLLPDYWEHGSQNSLLSPLLGLFKVRILQPLWGRSRAFFVLLPHAAPAGKVFFDLKGCLLHRRSKLPEGRFLKDLDVLESRLQLCLSTDRRTNLLEQLRKDIEFLQSKRLIDYSVLIAISQDEPPESAKLEEVAAVTESESGEHFEAKAEDESFRLNGEQKEAEEGDVRLRIDVAIDSTLTQPHPVLQELDGLQSLRLHLSLIDFLTSFGPYHYVTRIMKRLRYGQDAIMSTSPPEEYGPRLLSFIEHVIV